jgi:hypothetical protein
MSTHTPISLAAHQQLLRAIEQNADPLWREPLAHLAPQLLELAAEATDASLGSIEPAIRRLLGDHCAGRAHGDSLCNPQTIDRHTHLLLTALKQIPLTHLHDTPPQMFG